MSCSWMAKGAFSPSSCEERSPRTAPAWEKSSPPFALSAHMAPRAGLPVGSVGSSHKGTSYKCLPHLTKYTMLLFILLFLLQYARKKNILTVNEVHTHWK